MVTIGHDSEFGIRNTTGILSALDYLKPFETKAGRGFPDNMNCEIAINPVDNLKDFHAYTDELLKVITDQGFELMMEPTIVYPDEAMKNPLAYISGCDPDFSAYTLSENRAPDFKSLNSTRSCGAHIHVGDKSVDPNVLVRWMDLYLGVPLLLKEKQNNRRELYGAAGCLREKPYGVEYRTLSNVWLNSAETREFVWENTFKALEAAKAHEFHALEDWSDIPTAIDDHNLKLASQVIDRFSHMGVCAA